ncbi:MAG: transposase [Bacteroidales bacterium]|jgi:IS5 family transposase|nr:transposase [Bacteroidales bacterium]
MRKYKTTGNTTLFDKEDTERKLTEKQRAANREKSRTRSRVEHIFGFMENTMNRLYIRTVGLARATAVIGPINLTYNMSRYEQIVRLNLLKD